MNPEIILVDDDEILLIILEKMFLKVRPDAKLTLFSSGKAALDHLANTPDSGKKRFLLVDLHLKDLSGWDFLNELTDRKDELSKVFLFTASVNTANFETAKKYTPVVDFFEKPISFDKIHKIFELIQQD
jgi:FixJ family two-component response regulator